MTPDQMRAKKHAELVYRCWELDCEESQKLQPGGSPLPLFNDASLAKEYLAIAERLEREQGEGVELVDEAWLRSIGFGDGWNELYLFCEGTQLAYRNSEVQRCWILNQQAYPIEHWQTRRDVLQLLEALNIQPQGATK